MTRFGLIGTNWITERFIAGASKDQDFTLTAVYSRTAERANQFAEKYGIPNTNTDVAAMAASGEIDAIYIASPNSFHAEQAITAMEHGIHVLCEEPIASNSHELSRMIAAAKQNNVLLMEALKSTFMPGFRAVAEHIHKVGPVRRYFSSFCQYSSRYDAYKAGTVLNAFDPKFSNGSLMDIGIYCIYPAVVLFGKPKAVKATGVMLESGVDGEGSILLAYEDMDAVLMYSKITNSSLPTEIQGELGNLVMDKISEPEKVELRYRNGRVEDLSMPSIEQTMYYEAAEFIKLIKEARRESSINTLEISKLTMEIMDEARRQLGLVYPADKV